MWSPTAFTLALISIPLPILASPTKLDVSSFVYPRDNNPNHIMCIATDTTYSTYKNDVNSLYEQWQSDATWSTYGNSALSLS